ncbi:MAG TPA: response regulator, partial [Steroidobacteraceae bacterium]|nr:response regulator [Steroidobacteraceae bacterium]
MRVVIVDDEPAARRMLRESCAREADIEVVGEYGDGRTALQALAASPPDLLFLDIQMDGLTGL